MVVGAGRAHSCGVRIWLDLTIVVLSTTSVAMYVCLW
jgi:hypothetical protein